MKKLMISALALSAALRLAAPVSAQEQQEEEVDAQVVYGADGRIDLWEASDPRLLPLAKGTVALMESSTVRIEGGVAHIDAEPYGPRMSLCKEEPFYEQVTAAFCSGSLVAPDIIMTAGHCIRSQYSCENTKFVFGFAVKKKGVMPLELPAQDVYGCKTLISREQVNSGADWALIKLDRPVTGRKPLKLNKKGVIKEKAHVFVIGHPAGLPTKLAGFAKVRDASPEGYFVANLDTYGGNSGSPVFNGFGGRIEGILVRGETDYVWKGSCRVSNYCADDGCRGEDVTKISSVLGPLEAELHRDRVQQLGPSVTEMLRSLGAEVGEDEVLSSR